MKPELSSGKWSKVGGKFNQRSDSGRRWMKPQGQVNINSLVDYGALLTWNNTALIYR